MQNFSPLASKLTEEFEVTVRHPHTPTTCSLVEIKIKISLD